MGSKLRWKDALFISPAEISAWVIAFGAARNCNVKATQGTNATVQAMPPMQAIQESQQPAYCEQVSWYIS